MRNKRIAAIGFLNQRCALAPDLESMLLARMPKMVLQHYLPGAEKSQRNTDPSIDIHC
jgi:hypothetical protein